MSRPAPDFAAFPRARLTLHWNRRQLLTSLSTELRVRSERAEGVSDLKIADLGLFPDELIELLIPVVRRVDTGGEPAFGLAVSLMDGRSTIRQIADGVSSQTGWDRDRAFQFTRGVFLYLVSNGDCLPLR